MANTFSGIKFHLETLPVHYKFPGYYHCMLLLSQTPSIAILGTCNQASYAHALSPVERVLGHFQNLVTGCSQSPIFSWDRLDIPRLLDFQMYRGGGRRGLSAPCPLSSFDTQGRWQPVTQSARSRWSYGKIEDCEQSTWLHDQEMIIFCAEKLVKSANYVSNVFFRERDEYYMLVMTNYAKNYPGTIYQRLLSSPAPATSSK